MAVEPAVVGQRQSGVERESTVGAGADEEMAACPGDSSKSELARAANASDCESVRAASSRSRQRHVRAAESQQQQIRADQGGNSRVEAAMAGQGQS